MEPQKTKSWEKQQPRCQHWSNGKIHNPENYRGDPTLSIDRENIYTNHKASIETTPPQQKSWMAHSQQNRGWQKTASPSLCMRKTMMNPNLCMRKKTPAYAWGEENDCPCMRMSNIKWKNGEWNPPPPLLSAWGNEPVGGVCVWARTNSPATHHCPAITIPTNQQKF